MLVAIGCSLNDIRALPKSQKSHPILDLFIWDQDKEKSQKVNYAYPVSFLVLLVADDTS